MSGNYMRQLLCEAARLGMESGVKRGEAYITTVAHDSWCKLLNGKGDCNCDPEVRTIKINKH